jgi:hypothetical protein
MALSSPERIADIKASSSVETTFTSTFDKLAISPYKYARWVVADCGVEATPSHRNLI